MNHIFISYAHIDNYHDSSTGKGWVDWLHERLEIRLAQLLGRKPTIWRDNKFGGNDVFNQTTLVELGGTQILLTVLSPRYLASPSCQEELNSFVELASQTGSLQIEDKSRVFKVVKTHVRLEEQPEPLRQLLGYEFYQLDQASGRFREFEHELNAKGERDNRYWHMFEELAQDISLLLRRIEQPIQRDRPLLSSKTIYLAETTADLAEYRDKVRRELLQFGHIVLPDKPLPTNKTDLEHTVRDYLQRSQLSVHLIGEHYGWVPEMEPERSVIRLQEELARMRGDSAEFSCLIWLPPGLEAKDERQRRFIETLQNTFDSTKGFELIQTKIEDLKTIIQEKLNPTPKSTRRKAKYDGVRRIYLVCDKRDLDETGELYSYLYEEGYEVLLPEFDENELQADRQYILDCDAVLFFYSQAPEMWLRTRLRLITSFGRPRPLAAVGVYVTGTETPQKKLFQTREAVVIKNFGAFDATTLDPFINLIREKPSETDSLKRDNVELPQNISQGINSSVLTRTFSPISDAYDRLVHFARRFGEPHVTLAMHAAVPLGLTPELVHFLRIYFAKTAPQIAEADLLLSPLCREVGGGAYEVYLEVRDLLLAELQEDEAFGVARINQVAEFLMVYATRQLRAERHPESRNFLVAQQWAAFAQRQPREAARELAAALRTRLSAQNPAGSLRLAQLARTLNAPLMGQDNVLLYAAGVESLALGDAARAQEVFGVFGSLQQRPRVQSIPMPALPELAQLWPQNPDPTPTPTPTPIPTPVFLFNAADENYSSQNALTLAEAAQLAYADPDEINKCVSGWGFAPERIHHFHKKILTPPVDTQGYVFSNDEAIIVAFRGTKDKLDWLTDAKFLPVAGPNSIGKAHRGFERALEPIVDELVKIINRYRDNGQMLFYTGHSLGGALATLAARRVQFASNNAHWPQGVYTFGSPCVGDQAFADAYDKDLQSRTFRFVNNNDPVPRLLMATFRHVGRLLYFDADGRMNSETTAMSRFFNLLTAAVSDVRAANFHIDDFEDHGMADYLTHLKANLDKDLL